MHVLHRSIDKIKHANYSIDPYMPCNSMTGLRQHWRHKHPVAANQRRFENMALDTIRKRNIRRYGSHSGMEQCLDNDECPSTPLIHNLEHEFDSLIAECYDYQPKKNLQTFNKYKETTVNVYLKLFDTP